MSGTLSTLPFVVEAMGFNASIYPDIDRIYQEHKEKYYEAARAHELYSHQIVVEGGLLREEYCKKTLGILLCLEQDPELQSELANLFRKGWPYAYLYVNNNATIDLGKFINNAVRKAGGFNNVTDDWLNSQMFMAYFLALNLGKPIVENGALNNFMTAFVERWEHYKSDNVHRIKLDNPEEIEKVRSLKRSIYAQHGRITNFNEMYDALSDKAEQWALLFDYERLSFPSIASEVEYAEKNIEESLLAYLASTSKTDIKEATNYLCASMYIRYLIKAYKQVKQRYFENNKETMYIEMSGLEKNLATARQEVSRVTELLSEAMKAQLALKKEVDRLQVELNDERQARNELNGLREFLFSLDQQEELPVETVDVGRLTAKRAVIIGGHERWQNKMRELLPSFVFISADQKNFDLRLLQVPIIFVFPNYLSHSVYYRAIEAVKGTDTKVVYINQQNEDLALNEIASYM